MANEKQNISVLQIICLAVGIFTGLIFVRFVFGLEGVLGGALGGGLGAAFGMAIFALVNKVRR